MCNYSFCVDIKGTIVNITESFNTGQVELSKSVFHSALTDTKHQCHIILSKAHVCEGTEKAKGIHSII
jgi:hypothetical protein